MKINYVKRPYNHNSDIKIPKPHKLDYVLLSDDEKPRHRSLTFTFLVPKCIYWITSFNRRRKSKKLLRKLKERGWVE